MRYYERVGYVYNVNTPFVIFQFRYGTKLEITATCLGVVLGMLSGGGITVNLIQLGELSTAFVERTHPPTDRYSTYLPILSVFGGGRRL